MPHVSLCRACFSVKFLRSFRIAWMLCRKLCLQIWTWIRNVESMESRSFGHGRCSGQAGLASWSLAHRCPPRSLVFTQSLNPKQLAAGCIIMSRNIKNKQKYTVPTAPLGHAKALETKLTIFLFEKEMSQGSPKRCNNSKVKNYRSFDGTGLLQGNQYAHCDLAVESSSSLSTGTSFNGA